MEHYEIILLHFRDKLLSRCLIPRRAPESTETSTATAHQQVKTETQGHLNILSEGMWSDLLSHFKQRKGQKSTLKTDLRWKFRTFDCAALKVSSALTADFLGLSSLPQGSSLGKTDSSSLKHPLMSVALLSGKKPHENSPIHSWHVNWYSYFLVWFRKPYCCDFLVHAWDFCHIWKTLRADIPALSSDSEQPFHPLFHDILWAVGV